MEFSFAYRTVLTAEFELSFFMMNFPVLAFFSTSYASFAESYELAERMRSSVSFKSRVVLIVLLLIPGPLLHYTLFYQFCDIIFRYAFTLFLRLQSQDTSSATPNNHFPK